MKIFERITKRYALQNYYLRRNFYWPDTLPEILDYWQQHNDLPFLYGVDNWPYDVMCERQRRKGVYASQYLIPDRTARQMAALAVRYFDNDSRVVGAANLNLLLQQALNPSAEPQSRRLYLSSGRSCDAAAQQLRQGCVQRRSGLYPGGGYGGEDVESRFRRQMGRVRCHGARRTDAGLRHDDPQGPRVGISDRRHAGADDPLRDAPAQPDLYGYHARQKDLRADRCDESLGLCRPQYVRAEKQYEPSGAVESLPDDRRETPGLNLRQGCRHFLRR